MFLRRLKPCSGKHRKHGSRLKLSPCSASDLHCEAEAGNTESGARNPGKTGTEKPLNTETQRGHRGARRKNKTEKGFLMLFSVSQCLCGELFGLSPYL
ncbi:hypothetical protein DFR42_102255 [Undibacterium pigrum]|uniref:Uncharacterized protein n=1 Tax=Undibacterium pigrum TaxID=401470 RepID=A0A318JE29_9BURK|nr:hypothetical protein DFR42_102255 [Undibacterium pigrum]